MIINCTEKELIKMGKLAIMASRPMGMGFLHYDDTLKEENIHLNLAFSNGLYIDYFQGRMVKFRARKHEEGGYSFPDVISSEYESWIRTYPSYEVLYQAAKETE